MPKARAVKTMRDICSACVALGALAACTGRFDYVPPTVVAPPTHSLVVPKGRDEVLRTASARLIQDGFAINGVDKDAGVVTLTYSGNPERYVDCGEITSYVENVRGERRYHFAASTASTEYELMTGREIVSIARHMTLDASVSVTVTSIGDGHTRLSATADYELSRTMLVRDTQGGAQMVSHRIHFTSDHEGTFPSTVTCRASGLLEKDALSVVAP